MRTLITKAVAIGGIAVALALTASCGSSTRSGQGPPTTGVPATSTTTPTTSAPTPASMDVRVYFMRGDKIDVAHRTVAATQQVAAAAMTELLSGPTPGDNSAGLTTDIPSATHLLGVNIAGGTATVDLTSDFAAGGGSLSITARLAQVTYTLTQFPTIGSVVFHLDGKAVTVFGGEGIILDHPSTRATFESVTPAILVEFPGRGWAVQSPVRVAGTANVFEGQFQAEITDNTGRVIASQAISATSGTGTRGTFDATVSFPATATGPATLNVFDISAKDGSRIDTVTIPLQVAG
jgi:germination protein M